MKQKMVRMLTGCLCLMLVGTIVGCGSAGSTADALSELSAEEESESEEAEETVSKILELEDGTEIPLTLLDDTEAGVYGYYTCQNDGSVWVFSGSTLAVAYVDEEEALQAYICDITFYQAPADENSYYLCAVLSNTLEGTASCWYIMSVVDDEGNSAGLVLQDPGDSETYIGLVLTTDDEEE